MDFKARKRHADSDARTLISNLRSAGIPVRNRVIKIKSLEKNCRFLPDSWLVVSYGKTALALHLKGIIAKREAILKNTAFEPLLDMPSIAEPQTWGDEAREKQMALQKELHAGIRLETADDNIVDITSAYHRRQKNRRDLH